MRTQTIFQAGNSAAVAIPRDLVRELGFEVGEKIVVEKYSEGSGVIVRKAVIDKPKGGVAKKDFKKWVNQFLKEDADILDELAVR